MSEKTKQGKKGWVLSASFFVIIILPAVLFTGIVDFGPKHAYQEGVIDIAFTWGDQPEAVQELMDLIGEVDGLPIMVETRLREDDLDQILKGDSQPDLIVLSNNKSVQEYLDRGLITPLGNQDQIPLEDLYPAVVDQCRDNAEQLVCLPWGADVFALYWNKDLFSQAGLDPESPPATLEALSQAGGELTKIDPETGEYRQVGFLPDFPRSYLELYTRAFGSEWTIENRAWDSDFSQALTAALDWERELTLNYQLSGLERFVAENNRFRNSNHPSFAGQRLNCQQCHRTQPGSSQKMADHTFYNKRIAMMIDGQWQTGNDYLPLYAPEMNYGVAPLPAAGTFPNTSFIQGPVIVMPAGSIDQGAANQLLASLLTAEFNSEAAFRFGFLPVHKEAALDPRFQEWEHYNVFLGMLASNSGETNLPASFPEHLNDQILEIEKNLLYSDLRIEDYQAQIQNELRSLSE